MTDVINHHGTKHRRGHELHVRRVNAKSSGYQTSYENEFELLLDGEVLITASQLDNKSTNYNKPWVKALFKYGTGYADGLEDTDE